MSHPVYYSIFRNKFLTQCMVIIASQYRSQNDVIELITNLFYTQQDLTTPAFGLWKKPIGLKTFKHS